MKREKKAAKQERKEREKYEGRVSLDYKAGEERENIKEM